MNWLFKTCVDSVKAACCAGIVGTMGGDRLSTAAHRFHCKALGSDKAAYKVIWTTCSRLICCNYFPCYLKWALAFSASYLRLLHAVFEIAASVAFFTTSTAGVGVKLLLPLCRGCQGRRSGALPQPHLPLSRAEEKGRGMASPGPLQGGGGSQGSGCCCLGHLPGDFPGAVGLQCYWGVLDFASIDLQLMISTTGVLLLDVWFEGMCKKILKRHLSGVLTLNFWLRLLYYCRSSNSTSI